MACLLLIAAAAPAQTVLVVLSTEVDPYQQAYLAIQDHLREHEHRTAMVLLPDLVDDYDKYVTDETRAVVGVGTQAAVWLHRNAGESVLVTYCMVASPEDVGLTTGRDAFGVTTQVPLREQFRLIRRMLPGVRTVGMIYDADSPRSKLLYERVKEALPDNWRLRAVSKEQDKSIADSIDELLRMRVDVIWTAADASVYDIPTVRTLLLAAMRHQTPVFGFSPQFVRAGALFGIGINPAAQGRQTAELIMKRLRAGAEGDRGENNAAVNPPETPEYETAVNLIVAEKLRVDLPRAVVRAAEHVWPERKDGENDR